MALLVSVGTDGVTDWVKTPNGQRFNLGPVSALKFVTSLSKGSRQARQALDLFLKAGEAMLTVDESKMWDLMKPARPRWASSSEGPFMSHDQQDPPSIPRSTPMSTIFENLDRTAKVISYLNRKASEGETDPKAFDYLKKEAGKIKSPNQSNNSTYYGLGDPKVHEVTDKVKKASVGELTFDIYDANMKLAKQVLAQSKEVVATIDAKVAAGKKFNAVRARSDVHALTTKVASICESTQLTEDWVQADLQKLARRSDELHQLFHPKKS